MGKIWDFIKGNPDWGPVPVQYSYDWCRFRRISHCYFSGILDEEATVQAGYRVWVPIDRGFCPRGSWDLQQSCPAAEPGPHVPGGYTDATVPWEALGQMTVTTNPSRDYMPARGESASKMKRFPPEP